jgi:hypothetical protein
VLGHAACCRLGFPHGDRSTLATSAMTALSDAQLREIADTIFVMGDRATTRLPKPTTTGPPAFRTALDPIGTDPDFADAGIGVIDFTADFMHPSVWLHNADKPYRIGSASKIAMMLAAVQLRLDVRRILDLNIISTPAEFDEVFRDRKLWKKAKAPQTEMQQIAGAANAPLISKIFDFGKNPVDFDGPDPDGRTDPAEETKIVNKLPASGEVSWAKWTDFTFSERLWLTGSLSDNVAATACVSEIGVPYIKAVQRAYGLADPRNGMHLLASRGYDRIPRSSTPPAAAPPRPLTHVEPIAVEDFWWGPRTRAFTDQKSWVPGSAAALTAYMLALMTETFVLDPDAFLGLLPGHAGCQTIRINLADGANAIESFLAEDGVKSVANTKITRQMNKIGILKKSDGARSALICEFIYLETEQNPAPPAPHRSAMKYAVLTTGLIDDTSPGGVNAAQKSAALGAAVHSALLSL